jgi:hypothetical protein
MIAELKQVRIQSIVLSFVFFSIGCANQSQDQKKLGSQLSDTLNFGEADYNLMREYYNSDSSFQSLVDEKISKGDTNAIKMKELLSTPFSSRSRIGISDQEINVMIYSYYISKKVIDRFNQIDSTLQGVNVESEKGKMDSIINKMEKLKELLKEN